MAVQSQVVILQDVTYTLLVQCTYYVFDRVGGKIGSTWGNASNWANAAARAGYTVNNTPKAGAIMQTTQGAYGHVAYVESVNSNGSVRVSRNELWLWPRCCNFTYNLS